MKEEQTSSILEWYNNLEKRLFDFFEYMPLRKENSCIVSPRLVSITVETCSVLDSLFRHLSGNYIDKAVKNKKKDELNIKDYCKIYAQKLHLPMLKTIVMASPPYYLTPFESWSNIASSNKLYWWNVYNKLKHDRIESEEQCNLKVTLDALCGLHQVICKFPELCSTMLRYRWIDGDGYNPEYLIEILRGSKSETFLAVTRLFATPVGSEVFPDDMTQLRPSYYRGSRKLQDFLGHM